MYPRRQNEKTTEKPKAMRMKPDLQRRSSKKGRETSYSCNSSRILLLNLFHDAQRLSYPSCFHLPPPFFYWYITSSFISGFLLCLILSFSRTESKVLQLCRKATLSPNGQQETSHWEKMTFSVWWKGRS